jgi:hypothetical protein
MSGHYSAYLATAFIRPTPTRISSTFDLANFEAGTSCLPGDLPASLRQRPSDPEHSYAILHSHGERLRLRVFTLDSLCRVMFCRRRLD